MILPMPITEDATVLSSANTFLIDPLELGETKQRLANGDQRLDAAVRQLRRHADKALKGELLRVTDKQHLPPSGDPRDFYSIGTYWWPNPNSANGKPYVRRDGRINPESMDSDTGRVRALCHRIRHLALAWYLFGDECYAQRAAEQLRVWFLDPEHAMHPHLRFAQCIPGICEGRSYGIIDTRDFRHLVDGASLLLHSKHWQQHEHALLRQWMGHLLDWLLKSDPGRKEASAPNNHGTWYSAQVLSLALFSGRLPLARELARKARDRIAEQIKPDGEQPEEFRRSRPLTYCSMNLQAFFEVATLAEAVDIDLWHYQTDQGAGLESASHWLLPWLDGSKPWPEREIIRYNPENYLVVFRLAARRYGLQFDPTHLPLDQVRVDGNMIQLVYPLAQKPSGKESTRMGDAATSSKIAEHWDTIHTRQRVRWWHKQPIVEEINRRVCGKPLTRVSEGALALAREIVGERCFRRGVSVGGGSGKKEMMLLKAGLVEHFTVYELSPKRIADGRKAAKQKGLTERIEFIEQDAFTADIPDGHFDLVHWNNALHHMFDVDAALAWSKRVLAKSGFLYLDDYVGPNRFQWSDETLAVATRARASLTDQQLRRREQPEQQVPLILGRPSVREIVRQDPSEAPDSARILEALERHFPAALLIPTGGAIYNLALTHTLHNFSDDDPVDQARLRDLMLLDEMALQIPGVESHYAVAMAWRDGRRIRNPGPQWKRDAVARHRTALGANAPLWQRIARRLLPGTVRDGLNTINRKRLDWQGALSKRAKPPAKAPLPPQHAADPNGNYYCPLCNSHLSGFVSGGHHGRPGAKCPECGSLERHRVAWVYLQEQAEWLTNTQQTIRLLHVAPEPPMEKQLRKLQHIDYLSADIEPGRAMVTMDLTQIDMPDEQFDVIFCSHVLEHIPEDHKAMAEMQRVLKTGGIAYIQIPMRGKETYEDFSITSPEGRREAFGQEDHVRMYGTDIIERLQRAGFDAKLLYPAKSMSGEQRERMNTGNRPLIVCHKPAV